MSTSSYVAPVALSWAGSAAAAFAAFVRQAKKYAENFTAYVAKSEADVAAILTAVQAETAAITKVIEQSIPTPAAPPKA